jgi:hypothetical protein
MNKPDQPSSRADEIVSMTDEEPGEQSRAAPIVIQRKAFVIWLAATAIAGALLAATAMIVTGHSHSREEIARLEASIGKLSEEKQTAVMQLDELRGSHYAQVIAERRCEVIDGLEDCLKAGLKRPERFAEIDRQFLEARRAPASKPAEQGQPASGRTATTTARAESAPRTPAPAAPSAGRKMSLDEFAQELGKIPGVAVDGNVSESPDDPAPAKKDRTTSKPGS